MDINLLEIGVVIAAIIIGFIVAYCLNQIRGTCPPPRG